MAELGLVFGESGSRKTTALGKAAEYLYEKTGGKTGRAIYSDRAGWRSIQPIVEAGFIEPYLITGETKNFPEFFNKLSLGWWPESLSPLGLREPGVLLKPPTAETWNKVGFYLLEGLSSTCELYMQNLRDDQRVIGQDAVGKWQYSDSEGALGPDGKPLIWKFCSNSPKHFGFTQDEVLTSLGRFAALPVDRVLISAHEVQGDDAGDIIRGPLLTGKAATAKVGKNVGDMLHFEVFTSVIGSGPSATQKLECRAYFEPHPDQKMPTVSYKCKARVPDTLIAELKKKYPGGYFDPSQFGEYLRFTDELLTKGADDARKRRAAIDATMKARLAQKA